MKFSKIILILLLLCSVSVLSLSCASESEPAPVSENQIVTVQRGDLTIDIPASGNLALSLTDDLAFEIAGTVEEVLVNEGDTVEEGQMLSKLDTATLEQAVTTAERAAQTAKAGVIASEISLQSSEFDAEQAANDYQELITPYPYRTYEFILPESVEAIRAAQRQIEEAQEETLNGILGEEYYLVEIRDSLSEAMETLSEAEDKLAWGFDEGIRPTGLDYWTLRAAQIKKEKAQLALDTANNNLDKAKISLDTANDNLDKAKDELEKAVITAPFDGFITKVNVEGGDEVLKGTVAVQLADPNKFEADILVSEMDILQVELGGEAWVDVDAMQGMSLPAKVTHISPTATIQSGVVNYAIKVEIQSLEAVVREGQEAMRQTMADIAAGELPEPLRQAIEEGRITQEQAEEMIKQMQQAQETQQGQVPTMIPEDFQLREGLTVTVSILIEEKNNVLLVPNVAITSEGGQTYVQVVSAEGVTEERVITTGISDYQFTEVTEGLSEGEKVVVPLGTTTTTTTQAGQRSTLFLPGGGRPH